MKIHLLALALLGCSSSPVTTSSASEPRDASFEASSDFTAQPDASMQPTGDADQEEEAAAPDSSQGLDTAVEGATDTPDATPEAEPPPDAPVDAYVLEASAVTCHEITTAQASELVAMPTHGSDCAPHKASDPDGFQRCCSDAWPAGWF